MSENPLHDALYADYAEQFGALLDCLIGDAAAFGAIASRPHRLQEHGNAWERLKASAHFLHRHIAENDSFGFEVIAKGMALERAVLDAFGAGEETAA